MTGWADATITPDEGRNVPWHIYNIEACDNAKQTLLGLDGLMVRHWENIAIGSLFPRYLLLQMGAVGIVCLKREKV